MSIDFIRSDLWTRFSDSLKVVIKTLIDLNSSDEYEKWIIIPTFPYKDNESCGEIFYKNRETELHGLKLVEMDEEGKLLFATGPIKEKYWTAEKIRNTQIFKE